MLRSGFQKHMYTKRLTLGVLFWIAIVLPVNPQGVRVQSPHSVAEQYLFQSANEERQARGLPLLQWDEALYRAAWFHAGEMARRSSISHQYAGEPELAGRAQTAGVRFSVVAENVAEAPTATLIHRGWMQSEHHRENLLDPRLDHVAISVLRRGGELYAVEDFDRGVEDLPFAAQERAVAELLVASAAVHVETGSPTARETCEMETGYAGTRRPWFVMRFTASELNALPEALLARLASGRYREALVGACPLRDAGSFSGYNITVLLFP